MTICRRAVLSLGLALVSVPASAAGKPPVIVQAEQCLRRNVDRVVAVEPDVQSAASFLLTFACAAEVTAAARYERNVVTLKALGPLVRSGPVPPLRGVPQPPPEVGYVDPRTGEIVVPPSPGAPNRSWEESSNLAKTSSDLAGTFATPTPPSYLRKLAGDLVLAARQRQITKPR